MNVKKCAVEPNGLELRPSGMNIFLIAFIISKQFGVTLFCLFVFFFSSFYCFVIFSALKSHVQQPRSTDERTEPRRENRTEKCVYTNPKMNISNICFFHLRAQARVPSINFFHSLFCCLIFPYYFIES